MKEVLDFIKKRFTNAYFKWDCGNCYYFALILKERFGGTIFYDVIYGHFVTKINGVYFDYNGVVSDIAERTFIEWDKFDEYDSVQRERIIRDCIK